jgi:uncharacterized protein YrrD
MRFSKGAEVFDAKGEKIGTVNRVVIDAKTRDVTDLVVDRGLFEHEKVIPVGLVDLENEDRIQLRESNEDVDDFLDYETTHYVPLDQVGAPNEKIETYYWYPPAPFQYTTGGVLPGAAVMPDYALRTETSIPEGRIAISEGAQVISSDDKHIGNVEQVIADSETNKVTHFVVGKGFLLKEHKLVPSFWVASVEEDKIYLSVEAGLFERLPDYQPS